jgi:exo-beta-1,3-glucanase (GH17 family)
MFRNSGLASAALLFSLTALAVAATWWWLGQPVMLAHSGASPGEKLYCVSYAPFRHGQSPLVEGARVEPFQIDEDMALLSKYTGCVRTYSVSHGLEYVLQSARRYGLKVLCGIWVSNNPLKTRREIDATVALAKTYSDVIAGIVVGNEVLLRGEMSATELISIIREVKARVSEPVTYADVWEFWLRYPDVHNAVDFVTIHVLPYWEDFPIAASHAATHVDEIRRRIAATFPGKRIIIGEFGWPRAGRMREAARPSRSNQALAIGETLALAEREHFQVTIIEAFDQPWKRALEGVVGGYWGIFDRATGAPMFSFAGGTVSDHPDWAWQALAGILVVAVAFGTAMAAGWRKGFFRFLWVRIAALSFLPAIMLGWTIETVPVESFSFGSWLRAIAFAATAAAAPVVCAAACAWGRSTPAFSDLFGRTGGRPDALDWALGGTLIAAMLVTVEAALGLVFDPRYRDIPFAPLTATTVPFLVLSLSTGRPAGVRAMAERVAAATLAAAALYVLFNEGFANWQAVWFCAALFVLSFTLTRARAPDAPGSG